MATGETSTGGTYQPGANYTRTGGTDTGGTYASPALSGPLADTLGVNRVVLNPTAKTIANGSATALFNVTRANNVAASGVIFYQVVASDGTDFQTISGMVTYSHVDKAGTGTFTITEVAGNQAKAVSTGTYTLSWTYVTGTGIGIVKLTPTTSLTATTHTVTYTVLPISGAVAIQ